MGRQTEARIGDLLLGAAAIARFLYGTEKRRRDVYRNPAGLSFFLHGSTIAARKSTLHREITERERAGRPRRKAQAAVASSTCRS